MTGDDVKFGVNINNREPLIVPEYSIHDMLDISEEIEDIGFDSVWVGDSLFSKPRWEPLSLMSALSQRTDDLSLGTACLVTGTRNPLYTALEWATLDKISEGRTILGACMGNPKQGVKREYESVGLEFRKRARIFEEGLDAMRQLWETGRVSLDGEFYNYDDIEFHSGPELEHVQPVQQPPPMHIISNPRLVTGKDEEEKANRVVSRAAHRIVKYGDGWMTCCRAQHPDEYRQQYEQIRKAAEEEGKDFDNLAMSYQLTVNIADTEDEAWRNIEDYINQYYPALSQDLDLAEWGPVGTPEDIIEWIETFQDAGVDHFIVRFGSPDQYGQVRRFADEVLPAFQ